MRNTAAFVRTALFIGSGEAPPADEDSSATDDSWMNDPEEEAQGGFAAGADPGGGGGGVGRTAGVGVRSSWYRSQFKELENLGKGGFGTVVKVRAGLRLIVVGPFTKCVVVVFL